MNSNTDLPDMSDLIHEELLDDEEEELLEEATDINRARLTFLNALTSLLGNNSNSNVRLLPLSGGNNELRQILQQSLYEKNNFKKVLSEEGNEQLKTIKYEPEKFETHECVITQEKFKKDEDVIQLPCGHIFNKDAIKTWLKEESSKCPICRYELKFKEIKEEKETTYSSQQTENNEESDDQPENRQQRMERIGNLFQQMELMYSPFDFINPVNRNTLSNQRTFVNRIISQESQFMEDRALQNAIIASIHEQNINENDEYIEEKNCVEDDISEHPDYDFDTNEAFGDIESDSDIEF
jgi:hypothetical protein